MASEDFHTQPLDLELYRDDDDEEDFFYKKMLNALVNGRITPSEAARDFDRYVVEEANKKHDEILKRADPWHTTPEEEANGLNMRMIAPNTSGAIECIFPFITHLFSAFPPFHPGQNAIIEFLEALRAMPEHESYEGLPPQDLNAPYKTMILWPFGGNWEALPEVFRHEAHDKYSFYCSDMEIPWSEKQLGSRNLQSAMARLTSLDLINCGFLCTLDYILPSCMYYPDPTTGRFGGLNRIAGDVVAGAQWIIWPDQGRYVYRECKKFETISGPRTMWSMERWGQWKDQFALLAQNEKFDPKAKEFARMAHQKMIEYEEEDS